MKLTTFILFAALMQVSAASLAQRLTMSQKSATLKQVFNEINKQTGYSVIWSAGEVNANRVVSVEFNNTPLLEALDKCLENTNLTYAIENKTVVVRQKEPSLLDKLKAVIGAPVTVTAKVYDELGQPMAGVTVRQKDANNTTITDNKGNFSITVPDNNTIIVFSYVGYETQELAAKDIPKASFITLKTAENSLREVVINKGYYNEKNALSTGDVSIVSGKTIQEQPVSDPILALEGRVPGLNIQQTSGIPGAYSSVTIRGISSIANGNDPLYIVDGVPFSSLTLTNDAIGGGAVGAPGSNAQVANVTKGGGTNNGAGLSPFNNINPSDVESIAVLKDADATAIYGSRGANGVILITTKKGQAGKTKFDMNVFTGAGHVASMMNLLNTQQYLAMRREAFSNDGLPVPSIKTNPTDNNYDINGFWDTTGYTNWQKVLIGNTASFTNIQGNLSGGTANTQFLIGAGYSNQGTVYPGDFLDQKVSVHVNLTNSSQDQHFHAQFTVNYVNDNSNIPSSDFTNQIFTAPDSPPLYDANGNLNWGPLNGGFTFTNPLSTTVVNAKAITDNLISNLHLSYDILPGLQITSGFGYNQVRMEQNILTPSTVFPPPYNELSYVRSNNFATSGFKTWIIEPQINFKRKLGNGHLDALVGANIQDNIRNTSASTTSGYSSNALITNPLAATRYQLVDYNDILYHYEALYGRISYNLEDKYVVNLTARRDGSSRFGPGKQFGNFGAVGAAWIFSKEGFIENALPFLSFGKIRASYGTSGNDQITDYQYLSTYTPQSPTYQGVSGLSPTSLTNRLFAWEVVRKLEGGIEFGFIEDRINLTASYYRDRTGNQLVGYPLPTITGFGSVQYNLPAIVQNTGIEMTLNTINTKTKNFTWTCTANLTIPNNKLVFYPNIASSNYANVYVVGQSIYDRYLYHSTGVNPQTGIYSFTTNNSSGLPSSPQDEFLTKPVTQRLYGGLGNSIRYKGFQLDIFVQYVNQLGLNYLNYINSPGIFNTNEPTAILSRWQSSGTNTNIQRFGTTGDTYNVLSNYLRQSDAVISDASFLRLKNVALSYQIPAAWKNKSHLESARVYLQCQNLFTVTHYLGLDPESGGLNLPSLRMITAGIQFGF